MAKPTFFYRCEGLVLDADHDKHGGNDTFEVFQTGAIDAAAAFSGSYGMLVTAAGDQLRGSSQTVLPSTVQGSVSCAFRNTGTMQVDDTFFILQGNSWTDHIWVRLATTNGDDLQVHIENQPLATSATSTTDAAGLVANTWYNAVVRWTANSYQSTRGLIVVEVYDASGAMIKFGVNWAATFNPPSTVAGNAGLRIGDGSGTCYPCHVDRVVISDRFNAPHQKNFATTSYQDWVGWSGTYGITDATGALENTSAEANSFCLVVVPEVDWHLTGVWVYCLNDGSNAHYARAVVWDGTPPTEATSNLHAYGPYTQMRNYSLGAGWQKFDIDCTLTTGKVYEVGLAIGGGAASASIWYFANGANEADFYNMTVNMGSGWNLAAEPPTNMTGGNASGNNNDNCIYLEFTEITGGTQRVALYQVEGGW